MSQVEDPKFDEINISSNHSEASDNTAFTKLVRNAHKEKKQKSKKSKNAEKEKQRAESEKNSMEEKLIQEYNEKYGNNWYNKHANRLKKYLQPVSEEALRQLKPDEIEEVYTKCLIQYRKFKKTATKPLNEFEKNILQKGTRSDKIAVIVEVLRRDPLHNLDLLDTLLQECQHQHSQLALAATRELFCDLLMPREPPVIKSDGMKYGLLPFTSLLTHHLNKDKNDNTSSNKNELSNYVLIYVCDTLQKKYNAFLDLLRELSKNKASYTYREEALKIISQLLVISTSQNKLITLLVNMLNDTEGVVIERAMRTITYYLRNANHLANFRGELIRELVLFLYKPKVEPKKRKNAAILLVQARYESIIDYPLARHVNNAFIKMIKSAFIKSTQKKNGKKNEKKKNSTLTIEEDGGFLASVLIGFWRTYKIANDKNVPERMKSEEIDQVEWKMFADLARHGSFNVSFEALRCLWIMYQHDSSDDRFSNVFHNIIYSKLIDANILGSSKLESFLLLVLHVMSNDANIARVYAFTKRLMQSCLHGASSYSSAVLLTLAEAMNSIPAIRTLLSTNGIAEDDEDEMGNENQKVNDPKVYSVKEADPKKAHADSTSLWELSLLHNHYHPTVQSISCHFTENEPITYKGNPFSDLKVIKFLDEFVFDRKRMLTQQKRQIKSRFFKDQRKTAFKIDVKAIQVPKNYEEMLQKRKVIPQHMQFLKKFTELKKDLDDRVRKQNEKMRKKREKKKKKKLAIPVGSVDSEEDDEANGKYSYKNLFKAVDEDLDEMLVDTIMLENASDDEEEEEDAIAKRLANKEAIPDEDGEDDVEMQEAQEQMSNIFEKEEERLLRKKQLKKKKK